MIKHTDRCLILDKVVNWGNLRVSFPESCIEKSIEKIKDRIQARGVLGTFGLPQDGQLDVSRLSHLVTDLCISSYEDIKYLTASIETLETYHGKLLEKILLSKHAKDIVLRPLGKIFTSPAIKNHIVVSFDFVAVAAARKEVNFVNGGADLFVVPLMYPPAYEDAEDIVV